MFKGVLTLLKEDPEVKPLQDLNPLETQLGLDEVAPEVVAKRDLS